MERFHEVQKIRQWWLILIIAIIPVIGWYLFVQQIVRGKPVGNNPASDAWAIVLWLLCGIGVPLFFWWFRLETVVERSSLQIRMQPFSDRSFQPDEIAQFYARTYKPVREYGGWGVRGWSSNRAYNMSGDQGVQLVLTNGDRVLIGSQRPDALEHAIAEMTSREPEEDSG